MKFHERFKIPFQKDDIEQKFVNRVNIMVMDEIVDDLTVQASFAKIEREVAIELGQEFNDEANLKIYYEDNFYNCLLTLEILYKSLIKLGKLKVALNIGRTIKEILKKSEDDLGIEWKNGQFIRKGAMLLDKELINKSLEWLEKKKYIPVYTPFSRGLKHLLSSERNSDLLKHVIIDMYEAMEALAKIITGRDKDLSGNKDLFVSRINASSEYKEILKTYIVFANNYRHAESLKKERADLKHYEVESFVYLTGLLIRLCIQS